jgi:hypothetical protein
MNCCNAFGQCTNGHDCPARNVPTLREVVEAELGFKPVKPAKVGKRYHAAPPWAPSHWPKTIKALAKWMLIVVVFNMALGFAVGVFA